MLAYFNIGFLLLTLAYGTEARSEHYFGILLRILVPQILFVMSGFWYVNIRNVLKVAGDSTAINTRLKPVTVVITVFFSMLVFFAYQYVYTLPSTASSFYHMLYLHIAVSNGLALSVAVLTAIILYPFAINLSARGYMKIMK
jgi:hypothetical protein